MNAQDRRDEFGGNMDCDQRSRQVGQVSDLPQENSDADDRSKTCPASKPSRLWLWIVAAFVLQALAWTAWFTIASLHPVEEVPVIRTQAR